MSKKQSRDATSGARQDRSRRHGRERHISIRSELRKEPDVQKIARAIVAMALAQAEKEAQEQATSRTKPPEETSDDE